MMKQVNSPDIQAIDFDVLMDISASTPSMTLTNQSAANNPGNLKWVFEIFSPSGTPIYQGDFGTPDVNGVWNTPFVQNSGFPLPNYVIEWSGNPYTAKVRVQDSNNTIFEYLKPIKVCKPSGFKPDSMLPYGTCVIGATMKCNIARLLIEDKTNYSYGGLDPSVNVSQTFKLIYPMDNTGNTPSPKVLTSFPAAIRITQAGPGYNYFVQVVKDYYLGNRVTVRVKYVDRSKPQGFTVACNIDLSGFTCELEKLLQQYNSGSCNNMPEVDKKIRLVSVKMQVALIGILQPLSGIDPYEKVEEIKKITGWQCDCGPTGLAPMVAVDQSSGQTYVLDAVCGDISGSFEIDGSSVVLHLQDKRYVFANCPGITSAAFTITPNDDIDACIKTYCFNVNMNTLADELLTIFENNDDFIIRLSTMIGNNDHIIIDPKCLVIQGGPQSGLSFNYTITTGTIPSNKKMFVRAFITDPGNITHYINKFFDPTNSGTITASITEIEGALNGLGIGVWTAAYTGGKLIFTSTGNTFNITDALGQLAGDPGASYTIAKTNTSNTEYPTQTVVQALIDFVCSNISVRIKLGVGLSVKCLSVVGGVITQMDFGSDTPLSDFLLKFIACYNQLVDIVQGLDKIDCTKISAVFEEDDGTIEDTDKFYGNFGGRCASNTPEDVAVAIIKQALVKQNVKDVFCQAVNSCTKKICAPVANAVVTYDAGASTLTVVITNTGAANFRIGYRKVASPTPPLSGVVLVPEDNAGITTTYVFNAVVAGQYEVVIVAICVDGSESAQYVGRSASCDTPANISVVVNGSNFEVTFGSLPGNAAKKRVEIIYPSGGGFSANYATGLSPVVIPIPAGEYGAFKFVGRSVCSEAQGWFSDPTAVSTINLPKPADCPPVKGVVFRSITDTTMQVIATKPDGAAANAFTLRYTPQNGGSAHTSTANAVGSTVTWNLTGLTPNTDYFIEIITECKNGVSDAYNAGMVSMQASGTASSDITNDGTTNASTASVMVNGSLVHVAAPLNHGVSETFNVPAFANTEVKVQVCDASVATCTITSGTNTYSPTSVSTDGQTFTFSNVQIVANDLHVNFSN